MLNKLFKAKKEKTILLVEDDEQLAHTVEIALATKGYKILRAKGGHEGLTMALKHQPLLILLDIRLPDIDGWWVLKSLKETQTTQNVPVVVLTQLNHMGDVNTGFNLGAVGYLTKPIDLQRLYKKVEEQIKS
ncbi:MAG: response regulator [Elusimicrobia bacterium]|nr:response regulator [Elusimicrobiota bacterium]